MGDETLCDRIASDCGVVGAFSHVRVLTTGHRTVAKCQLADKEFVIKVVPKGACRVPGLASDEKANDDKSNLNDYLDDLIALTLSYQHHTSDLPPPTAPTVGDSAHKYGGTLRGSSAIAAETVSKTLPSLNHAPPFWSTAFQLLPSSSIKMGTSVPHPDTYEYGDLPSVGWISSKALEHEDSALYPFLTTVYQCHVSPNRRERVEGHFTQILSPRHGNILPLHALVTGAQNWYFISKYHPYSLSTLLHFNRDLLDKSEEVKKFLVFQILHVLSFCHSRGISLGNICPKSLLITDELWLYLSCLDPVPRSLDQPSRAETAMSRWVRGDMTNFDYLLELNRLAGRDVKAENPHYHPVLPWIIDFTSPTGGWRDLTKTKFRLKKGDAQLDEQYYNSHSNAPPHHITETLSEITFYVYLARKSSLDVLKRVVRHKFIPEEYPPSMERIYKWTPDECIPEFFTDSTVFASHHKELGLDDLQIPDWCSSPANFIQKHREALESDMVSKDLHHWIDLTFGYKLSGEAAVAAKNVPLLSSSIRNVATSAIAQGEDAPPWVNHQLHNHGIVQLFTRPHVPRQFSHQRNSAPQVKRWSAKEEPCLPHSIEDDNVDPTATTTIHLPSEPLDISRVTTLELPKETSKPVAVALESGNLSIGEGINPCLDPVRGYEKVGAFEFSYISLQPMYQPLNPKRVTKKLGQSLDDDEEDNNGENGDDAVTPLSDAARMGDVFTAGCLIAEVYQGVPLFDIHARQTYFEGSTTPNLDKMSATMRRMVSDMIAILPFHRPSLQKILSSEFFSSQADAGGVVMLRPYHLLHRFLHELQLRQHDVEATTPDPRLAEAKTEETLQNWKAQALMKWVIAELPALSCLPVKIYMLAIPFCLKLCFQPATLIPAIGLFDIFGEKLGKNLADEHLGCVVEKLLERHEGNAPQLHLFSTTFMQLVQRRFTHRYFLTVYLPHLRNSLWSSIPAVVQAGLISLGDFGGEGLRKQMMEEVVVLHVVVPMLTRLGKPGSQHAMTLLVRIAKGCGFHIASNLFLPNALAMIERGNTKRIAGREREIDLTILAGLTLLHHTLPELRLMTFETLLLESQVLCNLLVRPQCGPLPFVILKALLQIFDLLLKEILPTLLPKKKRKPDSSALNTICANVAQFITSLVQHLRQPDSASLPYEDGPCRDLLCLIYRSVKEALPVEILLQHFLYIDSLDALLREHGDKNRTVHDPCIAYAELARANTQQPLSPAPIKLLTSKSDVSVEMESRDSDDSDEEAPPPKRNDKPAYKAFEEDEAEALAKMHSAREEDAKRKEKEKKKSFFSSLFSSEKEPRSEGSNGEIRTITTIAEVEDFTPDSPPFGPREASSMAGFSLARPHDRSSSFGVDFSELSQLDPQQDVAQTWKFKATIRGTFRAHAAAISAMDAHSDRGLFLTASRDTTVKLWTLGLGSNMVHNPLTYRGHRHPVLDVKILSYFSERPTYAASCDNAIHIWDLETGIAVNPPSPNASSLDAYSPVTMSIPFVNEIISRRQMQHFTPHLLRPFLVQHPFASPYYSETLSSALPDITKSRNPLESPRAMDVGFYAPDDELDSAASFSTPPAPSPHASVADLDKGTGTAYFSLAPPLTSRHSDGVVCFEFVPERNSLVLGTRQASLRFLDLRVGKMSRPWRHTSSSQPTAVKSIAVCSSGNWIASGLASGDINVLELRCGSVLHQWKAHESPIVKLVAYSDSYLLSSAADRTMCLWHLRSKGAIMVKRYVGLTDSVKSVGLHKSDFICGVGHKLGISSLLRVRGEGLTKVSLVALKGYKSRNSLTALSIMSNYSLLLMGTEDGKLLVSV